MNQSANDKAALRRAARKVQKLLDEARMQQGRCDGMEVHAHFVLRPEQALRFRLALALLEELRGLSEAEIIADLLSRGVQSVMEEAAGSVRHDLEKGNGPAPDAGYSREIPLIPATPGVLN